MLCIVPKDFSSSPQLSSRLSSMSATGSPVTSLHLSSDRLEKNRFHSGLNLLSDYDTNTELFFNALQTGGSWKLWLFRFSFGRNASGKRSFWKNPVVMVIMWFPRLSFRPSGCFFKFFKFLRQSVDRNHLMLFQSGRGLRYPNNWQSNQSGYGHLLDAVTCMLRTVHALAEKPEFISPPFTDTFIIRILSFCPLLR